MFIYIFLCIAILAIPAKGNDTLEIRGLTWRTIAYYYHPGIYKEIYQIPGAMSACSKRLRRSAPIGSTSVHSMMVRKTAD